MKKTYTEAELKEKANKVFADFPNALKVFATLDGNVFLQENRAKLHAQKSRVLTFDRPIENAVATESNAPKSKTAAELIEELKAVNDLEGLKPFEESTFSTVKKEAEKKRAALIKESEVINAPQTSTDSEPGADESEKEN